MKYSKLIKQIIYFSITLLAVVAITPKTHAERKYLFKWDEGSGTNMPGWTWSDDVAYGHPGWTLNADGPFGGGKTYMWGYGPRNFEMGGATGGAIASIDPNVRAPSTHDGGSIKISDDDSNEHFPAWWLWYDGEPLKNKNVTDSFTDRMSFYVRVGGTKPNTADGPGDVMHVGTYLCENTGLPTYGTGDGCPFEGPGNQHYYHYLYLSPGAWIHVNLDRHPTHLRDSFVPGNDPAFISPPIDSEGNSRPMHYMEHLNQFYIQISGNENKPVSFYIDDMYFFSTQDADESVEPNQNDDSITSVWVGYWPDSRKWQIGWIDMSWVDQNGIHLNDDTLSTFEIRWSTAPITNDNYNEANVVVPEWFTGPNVTSFPYGVRRKDSWWRRTWTQFELPDNVVVNSSVIYFAIKDVSNSNGNAGTQWPYNKPDGHDAPSPYIKTIDYYIRPDNTSSSQYRADVDNNSQINTTDAMLTLRNSLGLDMSGTNWQSSSTTGDVNCDGTTNSTDAMLILRYSLGLSMSGAGWCVE